MKLKKFVSTLILMTMLVGVFGNYNFSYADVASPGKILGIEVLRESGTGYTALQGEKIIWKTAEYSSTSASATPNYSTLYYCLKAGVGFGSDDYQTGVADAATQKKTYTIYYDLKNPSSMSTPYSTSIPTGSNYNSLMWLLENLYIIPSTNASTAVKNEAAQKKAAIIQDMLVADSQQRYDINTTEASTLTDDDFDVIQQLAIWHFTNNGETAANVGSQRAWDAGDALSGQADGAFPTIKLGTSEDKETYDVPQFAGAEDEDRIYAMKQLYKYWVAKATDHGSSYTPATSGDPITFTKSSASATYIKNTTYDGFMVGPYKLSSSTTNFTISSEITDQSGNAITGAGIRLKSGDTYQTTTNDLKTLTQNGTEFYIYVPQSSNATSMKFAYTVNVSGATNITYWAVANNVTSEQPIVTIDRNSKNYGNSDQQTLEVPGEFDLALRKFITSIDGVAPTNTRVPQIATSELTALANGTKTTADKVHPKDALTVSSGSKVIYTIRVYNEGTIDGYATEVTDYLPEGLELATGSTINTQYGWTASGKVIKTNYLQDRMISAFNGTTLDYEDLQIECTVTAQDKSSEQSLTNIAEITAHKDKDGNVSVTDRDSQPGNVNRTNYSGSQQDDDDYEVLKLEGKEFDLALRKFIVSIDGTNVTTSREPQIATSEVTALVNGTKTTANKVHPKTPLVVQENSKVVYTIRVYNEGSLAGAATEITDHLPVGLTLTTNSTINTQYGWTTTDGRTIKTTYTQGTILQPVSTSGLEYVDVQVECTVTAQASNQEQTLKNVAEITAHKDSLGNTTVTDRDSVPNSLTASDISGYGTSSIQDDDDYEILRILPVEEETRFDLALRKFISTVNGTAVDPSREPTISPAEITSLANKRTTTVVKEHTKVPVQVKTNDVVVYTIRIYNEGTIDGYATEVTDYIPEGLEFVSGSTINTQYGWTTTDGRTIKTTYLNNREISAFDGTTIDYEDLKVECKVVAPVKTTATTLRNIAEITNDSNAENKDDDDSTPNNVVLPNYSNSQEDDDDFEDLVLPGEHFDLALRKFITKVNDQAVTTSREPQIAQAELDKLTNGTATTANKVHTKTPVPVKVGDKVTYTIRVYNEGSIDGYATEVKDFLPVGLKFDDTDPINTLNGWSVSADGRTVTTTILADKLLHAYPYNNGLDYQDIEIVCIVNAQVSTENTYLKNIAEITADSNDDRDSQPGNVNLNGYDGSQQDDDDFEDLVILGNYFDLALRKSIISVNGREVDPNRLANVDVSPLKDGSTTALYKHTKKVVGVKPGDIVIYSIRVYNEGQIDGFANEITDNLPPYLEFVTDDQENFNSGYGWLFVDGNQRIVKTNYLSKDTDEDNLIKAFDGGNTLDYKEVQIKCRVKADVPADYIMTNIAQITDFSDSNGNTVIDRDSQAANANIPSDDQLPSYKGDAQNKDDLADTDYFYRGQQDDDDFEKIKIEQFDLALRKFITKVNAEDITSRIPQFTGQIDANGNFVYNHPKTPVKVQTSDIVTYTLRIYNEGNIAGYAEEVKDDIPEGLKFLPSNPINEKYGWKMLDNQGNETTDVSNAKTIRTDYLSKAKETTTGSNLIPAFDQTTMTSPAYKEVEVAFEVIETNTSDKVIINTAEISDDADEFGEEVTDVDSTPDNDRPNEDDIDKEYIELVSFDLALRKFITKVNDTDVTSRIPEFTTELDENGNYIYNHPKTPVEVENGNIVTYTIRIFNEGSMAGYAEEIEDDIPEGLKFLPSHATNLEYKWVMLDAEGNETTDATKAKVIRTNYLSKDNEEIPGDNLIAGFDKTTMTSPDYKDVKVAFEVTEPNTSDRIIINTAEITDDSDENGNPVIDVDSTPDNGELEEDDIDKEYIKVRYFDLALRKWVSQVIITENGETTIRETGHTGDENPEPVVKVDLYRRKLNNVTVKFVYKIKIINEGQIAGYATEISDYIPEGLKFVPEDNPLWREVEGKIVTDQLKDTLLQPGDTAVVEVILTWINGEDNLGEKVNVAEISDDFNDSDTPDIDSVPDNKKDGEDDIDIAPVVLSIVTGTVPMYIGLTSSVMLILGAGIYLIKKYVLY